MKKMKESDKKEQLRDKKAGVKENAIESKEYDTKTPKKGEKKENKPAKKNRKRVKMIEDVSNFDSMGSLERRMKKQGPKTIAKKVKYFENLRRNRGM